MYHAGRYIIEKKLGWGHFSTVWLASDTTLPHGHPNKLVAVKVQKSAQQYTDAAHDEITILQQIHTWPRNLQLESASLTSRDPSAPAELSLDVLREVLPSEPQSEQPWRSFHPVDRAVGRRFVVRLMDHFETVGPNGRRQLLCGTVVFAVSLIVFRRCLSRLRASWPESVALHQVVQLQIAASQIHPSVCASDLDGVAILA